LVQCHSWAACSYDGPSKGDHSDEPRRRRPVNDMTPTVFVVDDDPSVLRSLARLLRASGFNVAPFPSAEEFLARPCACPPGCLVLDVAMPGLNGLELQQRLLAKGDRIPIVFLTGHGNTATSAQAMNAGAVAFLSKPITEDDLLAAVRAALEQDRLARAKQGS
jgi:FixJ family two-component response regulator